MIFVTVGTHEQAFDRLLEAIDKLKEKGVITDEVIMQTGFSNYKPKFCEWKKLFPYSKMKELVEQAKIVITHGGPSSFIMPLQIGKIPVVVPRKSQFNEHVNNHQVFFTKAVVERQGNIIIIEDIEEIEEVIINYDNIIVSMSSKIKSNNVKFCEEFEKIINGMFEN